MRIEFKMPFKILALFMASIMFSMPFVTLAQRNVQAEATAAAKRDAQNDINSTLWCLGGCLGGVIAIVIAYAVEPTPPATRLIGKSPEYVAFYTDAYTETAKKRQANSALNGCLANACASIALIVVAAAVDD